MFSPVDAIYLRFVAKSKTGNGQTPAIAELGIVEDINSSILEFCFLALEI